MRSSGLLCVRSINTPTQTNKAIANDITSLYAFIEIQSDDDKSLDDVISFGIKAAILSEVGIRDREWQVTFTCCTQDISLLLLSASPHQGHN